MSGRLPRASISGSCSSKGLSVDKPTRFANPPNGRRALSQMGGAGATASRHDGIAEAEANPRGSGSRGERQSTHAVAERLCPVEGEEERLSGQDGSKLDADLLTAAEIERLMRQCSRRAPTGVRNRALIAVCWRCGLRIGEALALSVKTSSRTLAHSSYNVARAASAASSASMRAPSHWSAGGSRRAGAAAYRTAPRCSALLRGGRWISRTSGTCFRDSRVRRGSTAAPTHTGYATPSPLSWSAVERRSTSCETRSGTQASRRPRCTSAASAPTRRSRR
jgi:hypothetical protein